MTFYKQWCDIYRYSRTLVYGHLTSSHLTSMVSSGNMATITVGDRLSEVRLYFVLLKLHRFVTSDVISQKINAIELHLISELFLWFVKMYRKVSWLIILFHEKGLTNEPRLVVFHVALYRVQTGSQTL